MKKRYLRLISLFVIMTMLFCACGKKTDDKDVTGSNADSTETDDSQNGNAATDDTGENKQDEDGKEQEPASAPAPKEISGVVESIERIEYKEPDHLIVLENDDLKMTMNSATTQFEVLVKKTGKVWYSTPQGAANDENALPTTRENLQSTLILTYARKEGVYTLYNNYANSIDNKTYAITESDDGISVKYYVGVPEKEFYIPYAMSEERFNTFLGMMSPDDVSWVKMQYKKYDLEKLSDDINKDALISMYPILNSGPAYLSFQIIKTEAEVQERGKDLYAENMSRAVKEKLAKVFEGIGYTEDDYQEDLKNMKNMKIIDESSYPKKPTFYVTVNYKLDGNQLVVEVPTEEIAYYESCPLIRLSILPYFGAAPVTDHGYMILPGTGGRLDFDGEYYSRLCWDAEVGENVPGDESRTDFNAFALWYPYDRSNSSFLCIMDKGYEYAGITADVSCGQHSYRYINATYDVVHYEEQRFGNNTGMLYVFEDKIRSDGFTQKYVFLNPDSSIDIKDAYSFYVAK